MRRVLSILLIVANILIGLALMASAWAGLLSPDTCNAAPLMVMALPVLVPLMLAVTLADLIWKRMMLVWAVPCLMVAYPTILEAFPVNGTPSELTPVEKKRSFTLLSYNAMNYTTRSGRYPISYNPTLAYIMDIDADIACLQETQYFRRTDWTRISGAQLDSVRRHYPHIIFDEPTSLTVMSRYPLQKLYGYTFNRPGGGSILVSRVAMPEGQLTLFSLHLRSMTFSETEKDAYSDIAHGRRGATKSTSLSIVRKLETAAIDRAEQTDTLLRLIERFAPADTPAVICGDFNDVPGSYPLRQLDKVGFRDVYPVVGRGYMPSYNADRFLFTIDHVLWRGDIRPHSLVRGNATLSDHYPLLTTFLWE